MNIIQLVGNPLLILVIAALFVSVFLFLRCIERIVEGRRFLLASLAWGLYAAWEWLVQTRTPEANIRVDLLLIWPVVAILSLWAIVRALPLLWAHRSKPAR